MEQNSNSNGNGKTVTTILVVGVLGIVGYLVYKAGKSTAASAAGAGGGAGIYPGGTPVTHPAAGVKNTGTGAGTTVGGLAGLATSILGMFKKKPAAGANTSPVRPGAGGTATGNTKPVKTTPSGSGTSNVATATGGTDNYNDWDGGGGFMVMYPDGSADYYYSDESYAGFSDPAGFWSTAVTGPNGGAIGQNNWDGAGGFIEDFGDGTWDYYTSGGEYAGSGYYDNDGNWVTTMDY